MQDIIDYFVALRLSVGLFNYEEESIGIVYLFLFVYYRIRGKYTRERLHSNFELGKF